MKTELKQKIISEIGTDISGKWISVDKVEPLTELIVKKCAELADVAEPYQSADLIKKHFGVE